MRYRQLHRQVGNKDTPRSNPDESFRTGGCCSCCVEDEEDRCCCCRCACCEPEGISAEYIMGVIPVGVDSEEEDHHCCCNREREKESDEEPMPSLPNRSVEPVSAQEVVAQPLENEHGVQMASQMNGISSPVNAVVAQSSVNTTTSLLPVSGIHVQTPTNPSIQQLQNTPPIVVVPESVLPVNSDGIPVLANVHLVEAVAEDGSGKTVYVAVPNVQ